MRAAAEYKLLVHDAVRSAKYVAKDARAWERRQQKIAGI